MKKFFKQWYKLILVLIILFTLSIILWIFLPDNETVMFFAQNFLWFSIESFFLIFIIERIYTNLINKREIELNRKITKNQRLRLVSKIKHNIEKIVETKTSFPQGYDFDSARIDISDVLNSPENYITKELVILKRIYSGLKGEKYECNFMAIVAIYLKKIYDNVDDFLNHNQLYLESDVAKSLLEFQQLTHDVGILEYYEEQIETSSYDIGSPDYIRIKFIEYLKQVKSIIEYLNYE